MAFTMKSAMKDYLGAIFSDKVTVPCQLQLRIVGLICCIISVAEFGAGGSAASYFDIFSNGAWWATVGVFFAGVTAVVSQNRIWVQMTCLLSFLGFVTAVIGTVIDSMATVEFNSLISCGSVPTSNDLTSNDDILSIQKKMIYYGDNNGAIDISYCMASYKMLNQFQYGMCYCVTSGGGFCNAYKLSKLTVKNGQNCGNIMSTYKRTLISSSTFCGMATLLMMGLFIFTSYLLCSRRFQSVEVDRELYPLAPNDTTPSEFEMSTVEKK